MTALPLFSAVAGLDPAIHVFPEEPHNEDVGARIKSGQGEILCFRDSL